MKAQDAGRAVFGKSVKLSLIQEEVVGAKKARKVYSGGLEANFRQ
jgi:hypothetical protein